MPKEELKLKYPDFVLCKERMFTEAGFYVIKYLPSCSPAHETWGYCDKPEIRSEYSQSFHMTSENTLYDCQHDLGEYVWSIGGRDNWYIDIAWRIQTPVEEQETRNKLYRFSKKRIDKWDTVAKY